MGLFGNIQEKTQQLKEKTQNSRQKLKVSAKSKTRFAENASKKKACISMYMLKKRRKRALIWIVKLNTLLGYHTRYLHCCWRSERGQTRRVCPWHAQERRPCRGLRRVDCPFQAGPGIRAKARGNRRGRHEQSGADPRMKLLTVYNNLLRPPASWKKKPSPSAIKR